MNKAILQVPKSTGTDTVKYIRDMFESTLGQKTDFEVVTNPKLIGGFIAEIDGKVYDRSVSTQLSEIKAFLLKG